MVAGAGRLNRQPVAVAACPSHPHRAFTELRLSNCDQRFPGRQGPFDMSLTKDHLFSLERMRDDFLKHRAVSLSGSTFEGQRLESPEHQAIIQSSHRWAAAYYRDADCLGYSCGLYSYYCRSRNTASADAFTRRCSDRQSSFYLPMATTASYFRRYPALHLRPLALGQLGYAVSRVDRSTARTGNRTLVIGDAPWVHQLLQAYVSKLFSLSYGITSLNVHSGDPKDHMLHHFGHRVIRGTLVFLGVPRWAAASHAER